MKSTITKLSTEASINGVQYIEDYSFSCGKTAPVFEVSTQHGLNQLLGNAKFVNREYGEVLYRGQCHLYETVMPSLIRGYKQVCSQMNRLRALIELIKNDTLLRKDLKAQNNDICDAIIEGVLQHYGVPTRYIDLVDNHWVALWMGQYEMQKTKSIEEYAHYKKRAILIENIVNGDYLADKKDDLYQNILLLAIPSALGNEGVTEANGFCRVDLRQALPSIFLRPHAQHGIVVRRKGADKNKADFYDIASQVVGIIKIRIDIVDRWLGNGTLLTMENLFPPAAVDYGYDLLLSRSDIFSKAGNERFAITRYY